MAQPIGMTNTVDGCGPDLGMDSMGHPLLAAGAALLEQGGDLLARLPPKIYTQRLPSAFNASIGGHYRHCLDHFACLLGACETGWVNYDHRERDVRLERDPSLAQLETRNLRETLLSLDPDVLEESVGVRSEVSYGDGDSPLTRSTLARELVYVIAHGIHHFALMAVMARLQGIQLPPEFGVAPSTLAHQAAVQSAA